MEEPCQNWFSDMEMENDDFFNQRHKIDSLDDEDQILQEIMRQPTFSSDSESHSPTTQNNFATVADAGVGGTTTIRSLSFKDPDPDLNNRRGNLLIKSNSSNSIVSQHAPQNKPATATSPTAYIMSFDDSTIVAATRETYGGKQPNHEQVGSGGAPKWAAENHDFEPRDNQTTRKTRSSSETLDHIMAERKRRRELTERFIALSATIPGLKKIDKATILSEAITHVKQLQERVRELEEQRKKVIVESVSFIQKSHLATDKGTASCAMNSDDCYRSNEALPTVEARVWTRDILIRIHCKKQNDIVLQILARLKSLDLFTVSNSVLPFGNSTLDISIIAQMGDKFNVTMNDLVKNLRRALLESPEVKQ